MTPDPTPRVHVRHDMRARPVTFHAIVRAVRDSGYVGPVTVEQTGGGVATAYVGPYGADGRATLAAIGPGRYDWRSSGLSLFYMGDGGTCIGPDDDGESAPTEVSTLADITEYLRPMLAEDAEGNAL